VFGVTAPGSTNFVIEYRSVVPSMAALPRLPGLAPMRPMALVSSDLSGDERAKNGALIALSLVAIAAVIPAVWLLATQNPRPRRTARRRR
jgi:hypothetical protein